MISAYWIGKDIQRNHHSTSCSTNLGFVWRDWWYEGYVRTASPESEAGTLWWCEGYQTEQLVQTWGWDLLMTWGISDRTASPKPEAGIYWWHEVYQTEQLVQNLRLGLTDDMRDIRQNSQSKTWGWDLLMTWRISDRTASPKPEAGTYWWHEGYQTEQLVQNLRLGLTDDMRDIRQSS